MSRSFPPAALIATSQGLTTDTNASGAFRKAPAAPRGR